MNHNLMINMTVDDVLLNRVLDYSPSLLLAALIIWFVWLASRKLLTYDLQLKAVEDRLDRVEIRLDRLEESMDKVESRLDRIETQLQQMNQNLNTLTLNLNTLTSALIARGLIPPSPL